MGEQGALNRVRQGMRGFVWTGRRASVCAVGVNAVFGAIGGLHSRSSILPAGVVDTALP
jgi:hypothetical protein